MTRTLSLLVFLTGCLPIGRGKPVDLPPDTYPVHHGVIVDEELAADIDAAVLDYLYDARMPSVAVGVYGPGEVYYTGSFGWAELETARELKPHTPVLLSSVSKTFIGVAAMQGVEAGRLALADRVSQHTGFAVDNPRVDGERIELIDLLTHTSGLSDSAIYGANYSEGDPVISLRDFEEGYVTPGGRHHRRSNWSKRAPGEAYEYSNVGAGLAALAIGDAAGLAFSDLVRRDILEPLGMDDSAYFLADQTRAPAIPYGRTRTRFRAWEPYGYPTYPDGMMRSGADDLARYGAAMLGGGALDGARVLSEASVERMLRVDERIDAHGEGQAVVWVDVPLRGRTVTGHNGGDFGSFTELYMDREAGVGFLLLFNAVPMDGDDYRAIQGLEAELLDLAESRRNR
mgnify:CR=1 FL=1